MAHECPDCGQQCYCNGDWDDCCNNFPEEADNCTHCLGKEDDDWDDDFDWSQHENETQSFRPPEFFIKE